MGLKYFLKKALRQLKTGFWTPSCATKSAILNAFIQTFKKSFEIEFLTDD